LLRLHLPLSKRNAAGPGFSQVAFLKELLMRPLALALLLPLVPALALAQSAVSPDLLADWQRNRTTVLAYIDAMPDSATNFRPTPGVRSFAGQFDHIVSTNLDVAAVALRGLKTAPALGDTAVYLHNKAALRKYAAATYDYFLNALQQASPAQLKRPVAIYGQPPQPAERLVRLSFEHSVWTLGQVVPYLRLNGVTPPEYKMPF
jgi:uncharacterized damage-inducible protein DinB